MKPHSAKHKLQCDACYYVEPIDRLHEGLIGKECPDCSTVMVTAEDYRVAKRASRRLTLVVWISRVVLFFNPKAKTGVLSVQIKDGDEISSFRKNGAL